MTEDRPPGGLLLTGGRSARMGRDKASLEIDGLTLAVRTGRLLAAVASPAIEVGPGYSGLDAVREEPAGGGPLVALVAGADALRARGHLGPVLLVACDLPRLSVQVLQHLIASADHRSAVPLVAGMAQPLCACYRPGDLDVAATLVAAGKRSMRALVGAITADYLDLDGDPLAAAALSDVDTPQDLRALGIELEPPGEADTLD